MPSLNFPWCNVRSLPLVLSLVTWEKGQTPPDLQLQRVIESPMRLIFSRLNIPSKLSCSLQDLSFRPFTSFIAPLRHVTIADVLINVSPITIILKKGVIDLHCFPGKCKCQQHWQNYEAPQGYNDGGREYKHKRLTLKMMMCQPMFNIWRKSQ